MKKLTLFTLLLSVLVAFGAPAVFAGAAKVSVCHIPPGNPDNFHTITIGDKALAAHLKHGDITGPCDAACATLCDDGDACTIDDAGDCEQNGCPATPEAVDCNDVNPCTTDLCEPTQGCVNTPAVGAPCDDSETCTMGDICDAMGACGGSPVPNCCNNDTDCSPDACDNATCNTSSNECENNTVECNPTDLCHVSVCDSGTGACAETPTTCAVGETCDLNTGDCTVASACPCEGMTVTEGGLTATWGPGIDTISCFAFSAQSLILFSGNQTLLLEDATAAFTATPSCGVSLNGTIPVKSNTRPTTLEQATACVSSIEAIAAEDGVTCD